MALIRSVGLVAPPRRAIQTDDVMAIDRANPIAKGIEYCRVLNGPGKPPLLIPASASDGVGLQSSSGYGLARAGIGLSGYNASLGGPNTGNYPMPLPAGTMLMFVSASFAPTDGQQHYAFINAASSVFPSGPGFDFTKFSDNNWYFGWWTARCSVAAAGTFNAGDNMVIGGSWGAGGTTLYVKGVPIASNGSAPSGNTDGGNTIFIIGNSYANSHWNQGAGDAIYWVATWNRTLGAAEIASLNADPWQLTRPVNYLAQNGRGPNLVASGGRIGGTLAGPTGGIIF